MIEPEPLQQDTGKKNVGTTNSRRDIDSRLLDTNFNYENGYPLKSVPRIGNIGV